MMCECELKELKLLDFSEFPGGRHIADGPKSGEEYREKILRPALAESSRVLVDLTGVFTVAPSFLDEAFGPIVEELGADVFRERVTIRVDDDPDALVVLKNVVERRTG